MLKHMDTVENWSDFLREPTRVLPQLERGEEVILRRRDGAALRLSLDSKMEAFHEGAEIAAHVLKQMIEGLASGSRATLLADALKPRLPWTRLLPASELEVFVREFAETLEACAAVGNVSRLSELLDDWKATAAIHADPKLAADLKGPLPGSNLRVPRPAGGSEKR